MSQTCPSCNGSNSDRRRICVSCGESLRGNNEQHRGSNDPPPHIADALSKILHTHHARRHHLPACMPQDIEQAVQFWIGMQEAPAEPSERPHKIPARDGAASWRCPYHDRLSATLRTFLGMSTDEQRMIITCREDDVFWRGEPIDFLLTVAHETLWMREIGMPTYRREAMTKYGRFIAGLDS